MMNLQRLVQHPLVQILTLYVLWQCLLLAIYQSLKRALPSIFLSGPVGFLLPEAIPALASLVAVWIMILAINRRTFASLGFTLKGCIAGLSIGFLFGSLGYAGYMAISWLGGWYHIIGINQSYYLRYALLFCFLLAVAEETIFRGYIFQVLEDRWGTKTALFGSSLLFGLAHVINLDSGGRWQNGHILDWVVQPILSGFVGGILFSGAYLSTWRIWMPIGLHCAWDTGATLFFNNPFGISSLYQASFNAAAYRINGIAFWLVTLFIAALALLLLQVAIRKGNWRSLGLPIVPISPTSF